MTATLNELLAQKAALDAKIQETRDKERSAAIDKVRELMSQYGLTAADLTARTSKASTKTAKSGSGPRGKVAAKYRDASTGNTWSGRGLQPVWLRTAIAAGRKLTDFAV